MNESESTYPPAIPKPMNEDLRNEVQSLRAMLSVSLIVLIMFQVCVALFLFKQVSMARAQAIALQQQVVDSFSIPQASEFWNKMNEYSKTHPDYEPIISKYRAVVNQYVGSPGGGAQPKK